MEITLRAFVRVAMYLLGDVSTGLLNTLEKLDYRLPVFIRL